jgi:UDP-N-acetyl-2-amino-2-deoxyglucuronate dehydrogenase
MSTSLGVGLIGCGEIAVKTATSIAGSEVVRVVACFDPVQSVAEDMAARCKADPRPSVDALLADERVEMVVISTPHYLHAPLAIQALAAGKHVLVEKPIACTLTQADEMLAAADRAQRRLGVLFPLRFSYAAVKARELIAAGALGRILAVKFHALGKKPDRYWRGGYSGRVPSDWRVSLDKSGGGYLVMNLIHDLDLALSLMDFAPERIYAEYATLATPVEVEDFISFVMRLKSGALVSLDGSSAAAGNEALGDRFYGEKGQAAIVGGRLKVFLEEAWADIKPGAWVDVPAPEPAPDPRRLVVEDFASAVLAGREPIVSGREGRRSLEIVRGAYLSMKRGRPVIFPVEE